MPQLQGACLQTCIGVGMVRQLVCNCLSAAPVHGVCHDPPLATPQEYVNSGQLAEGDVDTVLLNMGQPMMEVFLRKDEDSGRLRSCATAIVPSDTSLASRLLSLAACEGHVLGLLCLYARW